MVHTPVLFCFGVYNGVNHDEDPVDKGNISEDHDLLSDLGTLVIAELFSKRGNELILPP